MSNNTIIEKMLMGVIVLVGFVLWAILVYYINGYTISAMWEWFVVPVFGVSTITILESIGLGMLIMFVCRNLPKQPKDDTTKDKINHFTMPIIRPLATLFAGWIVKGLM